MVTKDGTRVDPTPFPVRSENATAVGFDPEHDMLVVWWKCGCAEAAWPVEQGAFAAMLLPGADVDALLDREIAASHREHLEWEDR